MSLMFDMAELPAAMSTITNFFKDNIILAVFLFSSYALFYIYQFVHNKGADSEIYEMDVLSSGVSSMMTALLLIGLDENTKNFSLSGLRLEDFSTQMALALFVYGTFLAILAFTKILPRIMVILLGNSELDLFINLMVVLSIQPTVQITGTLIVVIAVPLAALLVIQRIRRAMG